MSAGVFLYLEGEQDRRWGFVADLDLLTSTDRADGPGGTIEIDEDTIIAEVDVTFRPEPDSTLQFLAGVRMLDSSQDIQFPVLPDTSSDTTQFDPVVGAQGTWDLGKRWWFRLRGDVGGFGLDSDLTYQGLGLVGWEFSPRWHATAGYRMIGWEYEDSGDRVDLQLAGFLFGLAFRF